MFCFTLVLEMQLYDAINELYDDEYSYIKLPSHECFNTAVLFSQNLGQTKRFIAISGLVSQIVKTHKHIVSVIHALFSE